MHGRTLWVHHGDVAGPLDDGCIVRAAHPSTIGACAPTTDQSRSRPARCWRSSRQAWPWGAAMA